MPRNMIQYDPCLAPSYNVVPALHHHTMWFLPTIIQCGPYWLAAFADICLQYVTQASDS